MHKSEDGFTLVELGVVGVVLAIVLTLGASAFSRYWKVRALNGSVEEVVSELRAEQQGASTQTHPWVMGAWFKAGTSSWGVVRANSLTGDCIVTSRRTFGTRVVVSAVSFDDVATGNLTANCVNEAETGSEVVFFFARGTATGGSVSLKHAEVSGGAARTITVSPVTGRVTRP